MKRTPHPLEEALQSRVRLLATTLRPATAVQYNHTVRVFLAYLREAFPQVRRASDLRRDPHLLSWLEHLWMRRLSSGKPLSNPSRAAYLKRYDADAEATIEAGFVLPQDRAALLAFADPSVVPG